MLVAWAWQLVKRSRATWARAVRDGSSEEVAHAKAAWDKSMEEVGKEVPHAMTRVSSPSE